VSVPLLSWRDPLPWSPSRVLVAGTSGAGKTSLAMLIAHAWQLPRVELDALHHGENWTPRPTFVDEVERFAAQPRWVTEWQYTAKLGELLHNRADLVVWLDHPRHLVMRQVVVRTVIRRIRREILWNGNVEPPLRTVLTDSDHVIRWAWRTQGGPGERVALLLQQRGNEVAVVRLRGRRQVHQWVRRQLSGPGR
jgi:adenylate kinase family enzyme